MHKSCWSGSSGRIDECDMVLNPALAWQLVPDSNNFFQSTVLHEAGHIRGLDHYNNYLSLQNSGGDKILRGEVLYMDDKEAVRQNASHINEFDIVLYNKYQTNTTENQGGASAASTTRLYLSTDRVFDAGDIPLGSRAIPALAAGESSSGTTAVTLPAGTVKGKYFLITRADADEVLAESDKTNNNFARAIFISSDLIIARLRAPGRAVAVASITVSDTTKNSGGNRAGASITRYYLSTDALQNPTDVVLGRRRVAARDPQAEDTGSGAVTVPSSIAPGDYFLIAKTDATLLVRESQEGNNTSSRPITILPPGLLTTESQDH